MIKYQPKEIESKWEPIWDENPSKAEDASIKEKFYALAEFPYPSGTGLHMGHAFTFTILDVLARKKRMEGLNVLYPMGWDAFGLPTENYAIKTGIQPSEATKENTDRFRKTMKKMGFSYNWDREVNTTDPSYYKWTQWIFLQMFKHGLAYKSETPVGWCPSCKIILANEEMVSGKCERCGNLAEHRQQSQWLLRITKYADRLADELDLVDFPESVELSQRNWIGKTSGVSIKYPLIAKEGEIACYSTRPDTNFGATFVVIAPEHPKALELATEENLESVKEYINASKKKTELERTELDKEKTGVFTGTYCLNRLNNRKMPIYVADFVVATAGTGIVVGVPAHDERDFDFAKKYDLEIIPVIKPKNEEWDFSKAAFTNIDENTVVINSEFLDGLTVLEAKEKIIEYLVSKGWGERAVNYHLRDWVFSRQHYWGEPIPMVFCEKCAENKIKWWDLDENQQFKPLFADCTSEAKLDGWFPIKEEDLPLTLPEIEKYQPTNNGESPLSAITSWVETKCPNCGEKARRETDTMPNWAGSSWYYLRYCDVDNTNSLADIKKLEHWLPVDLYMGGAEHTTLHLLYSRFWHKFLNDIKVAPGKEPYQKRCQHGVILGGDGQRMSKSRGNVVNPEDIYNEYGVDALRVYLMFMGPYDATMPWNTQGVEGCYRFLNRIWQLCQSEEKIASTTSDELEVKLAKLIRKVGGDIDSLKHNTAIAAMMEFLNSWSAGGSLSKVDAKNFLKILSVYAPYLTEELYQIVSSEEKSSIHNSTWPTFDAKLASEGKLTVLIQVNGKLRGKLELDSDEASDQKKIEELAKQSKAASYISDIKKVIFVPGKLVNFVV